MKGRFGIVVAAGGAMAYYRLYFMNSARGQITEFRDFECADDRSALEAAEKLPRTGAMELWCRARKVGHWTAAAS